MNRLFPACLVGFKKKHKKLPCGIDRPAFYNSSSGGGDGSSLAARLSHMHTTYIHGQSLVRAGGDQQQQQQQQQCVEHGTVS